MLKNANTSIGQFLLLQLFREVRSIWAEIDSLKKLNPPNPQTHDKTSKFYQTGLNNLEALQPQLVIVPQSPAYKDYSQFAHGFYILCFLSVMKDKD